MYVVIRQWNSNGLVLLTCCFVLLFLAVPLPALANIEEVDASYKLE